MTKPNPFTKCASFLDVSGVLQKKAEWLQGAPLEVFEASHMFVSGDVLSFGVKSSITILRCRGNRDRRAHVGDLLTGHYHQYDGVVSRRVREWDGGGFRNRLEMGSRSGNNTTFYQVFRIPLKWLPLLRKKHEHNRKTREKLGEALASTPVRTPEDLHIISQFEALQNRDAEWRKEQAVAVLKKRGEYDLSTGEKTFYVSR